MCVLWSNTSKLANTILSLFNFSTVYKYFYFFNIMMKENSVVMYVQMLYIRTLSRKKNIAKLSYQWESIKKIGAPWRGGGGG